ncbi:class I SAM-dependent methyltransferase [Nocardioides marinquilinus]|uniref:Class I SAM-dependent methyltransferase n=1 Tax=Nocardioides marinquilinus TaxID=1210400 RepID=A0ABP9Q1I2_9ACTN
MSDLWRRVARAESGDDYAEAYEQRFRRAAAEGADVHGEAAFVSALAPPPARVLDAGCGTGRVARRLAALGHPVVGVDDDAAMVEVARRESPGLTWHVADVATLDLDGPAFDVVVLAGNVVPFLAPGSLPTTLGRLATYLVDGGLLVAGFGTDAAHVPDGCPPGSDEDYAAAARAVGLVERARHGTWDGGAHDPASGYVVRVHARG